MVFSCASLLLPCLKPLWRASNLCSRLCLHGCPASCPPCSAHNAHLNHAHICPPQSHAHLNHAHTCPPQSHSHLNHMPPSHHCAPRSYQKLHNPVLLTHPGRISLGPFCVEGVCAHPLLATHIARMRAQKVLCPAHEDKRSGTLTGRSSGTRPTPSHPLRQTCIWMAHHVCVHPNRTPSRNHRRAVNPPLPCLQCWVALCSIGCCWVAAGCVVGLCHGA